jgi:hypothetical protein
MPEFTNEGRYRVILDRYTVKMLESKDDPNGFIVKLHGVTEDGYEGWGDLFCSMREYKSGKNAGKTMMEVTEETLEKLGVPKGYLGELDAALEQGLEAEFVVREDEYNGAVKMAVKFINPVSSLLQQDEVDLGELVARLKGSYQPNPVQDAVVDDLDYGKGGDNECPF